MDYCMPNRIAVAVLMVVALSIQSSADELKKIKTKTITLKVQFQPRDSNKSEPIHFDMIQLPPGKITLKDKDGKEVEHTIKPIWLGKYEVCWNDYDPFWQPSDLDIGQRRNGVDAKSRPSKPYMPPDGGYGIDGFMVFVPSVALGRMPSDPYETFRIKTDNVPQAEIAGWLLPAKAHAKGTLFILHGYNNNKGYMVQWDWVRDQENWNVIMIDFREHGESSHSGHLSTLGFNEIWDVKAAVDFAESRGLAKPYAIFGRSLGASTGLR